MWVDPSWWGQHPSGAALRRCVGVHDQGARLPGLKHIVTLVGDAVNVASRMVSQGAAGAVQCSGAAATLIEVQGMPGGLRLHASWLEVKGQGRMETFWLSRKCHRTAAEAEACAAGLVGMDKHIIHDDERQAPACPEATSSLCSGKASPKEGC